MVLAGEFASPAQASRFRLEAELAARVQHPNIAQVYEVGIADDGRPFFAMEFIRGLPLDEYANRHGLDLAARVALVARVCEAVHHAHDQGVIHRDLKPANILVEEDGQPKVLDFGVARATNADLLTAAGLTRTGQLLGTPNYMSPEQVTADPAAIDRRADVYALGVILFELAARRLPYRLDGLPLAEAARLILEQDPPRLGSINPELRGNMETIVAKARRRTRRGGTRRRRTWRRTCSAGWPRADPGAAGLRRGTVRAVVQAESGGGWALGGGVSPAGRGGRGRFGRLCADQTGLEQRGQLRTAAEEAEAKATREADRAGAAGQEMRRQWYAATVNLMQPAWDTGQIGRLRTLLAETEAYPDRGFEWYYWQRLCHSDQHTLIGHRFEVLSVSWSPDGTRLATGSEDITAKVWDVAGGREMHTLKGHTNAVSSVSWSPDGTRLATGSHDGTAKVWDAAGRRELLTLRGHTGQVRSVSWSPDGTRLATGSDDGTAKIWDASGGHERLTLRGHAGRVFAVTWSPDGTRLATGSDDRTAKVWDAADGRDLLTLKGQRARSMPRPGRRTGPGWPPGLRRARPRSGTQSAAANSSPSRGMRA